MHKVVKLSADILLYLAIESKVGRQAMPITDKISYNKLCLTLSNNPQWCVNLGMIQERSVFTDMSSHNH